MKKLTVCVLFLCALLAALLLGKGFFPPDSSDPADGTMPPSAQEVGWNAPADENAAPVHPWQPEILEWKNSGGGADLQLRSYAFPGGDRVNLYRVTGGRKEIFSTLVPKNALCVIPDANGEGHRASALHTGSYRSEIVTVSWEGTSLFFQLPKSYLALEGRSIRHLPKQNGTLDVSEEDGGWRLTVTADASEADFCDALILRFPDKLDWSLSNCAKAWRRYLSRDNGQWCFDGYYYASPSTYTPTGEDCYYFCPAAYIVGVTLSRCNLCAEARPLAAALLDTMARSQSEQGFWRTDARSEWLYGDFGIDSGFYDTRFNTDLIQLYCDANALLGEGLFTDTLERYAAFYLALTERTHWETDHGGWIVPDYWHPDALRATPHTALNHQAAECLTAYHLADLLDRADLRRVADRLLRGIEDTAEGYVMPNHNLHYAILPDGSYGLQDYPELTYNDLLALQRYLPQPSRKLQLLMDEKKTWMDNNSVTWYNK